jgi:outer membrane lipoprotein carrier protein
VRTAILFVLASTLVTFARDADSVRHALEARYQHARTLRATFYERYTDGNGGSASEAGTVYFSRPGRMRWEYESPEQKLFIVDGTNVWFYVPADRSVSRAKLKESSDWRTPLALLTGKADLSRLCRTLELANPDQQRGGGIDPSTVASGNNVLLCIPRDATSGDSSNEVLFETDSRSELVRVLIHEPGGVQTEFRFGNWEENTDIPEVKFHFQPPPGVAIVDEESLANEIH